VPYNIWSVKWDEKPNCIVLPEKKKIKEIKKYWQLRFKSLIQEGSDLISIFDKGNYCH
jgi:hypothetical protein